MRTPCISHPPNEPLVLIRRWQIAACGGNHCAAALLAFFEHAHTSKLAAREQAESANETAEAHGQAPTHPTSLLQWYTEEELQAGLLGLYGAKSIRKALELLCNLGFLTIEPNPNPRYPFDKKRYFLFHPSRIRAWLETYTPAKMPHRSGKNAASCGENAASLKISSPEISSEISQERETRAHEPDEAIPMIGEPDAPRDTGKASAPPARPAHHAGHQPPVDTSPSPLLLAQIARDCPLIDVELTRKRFLVTTFRTPVLDWDLRLHKFCLDEQARALESPGRRRSREPTEAERQQERADYDALAQRFLGGGTPSDGPSSLVIGPSSLATDNGQRTTDNGQRTLLKGDTP